MVFVEVFNIKNEIQLLYFKLLKWLGVQNSFLGYIAGPDKLPAPLNVDEESELIVKLNNNDRDAINTLIEILPKTSYKSESLKISESIMINIPKNKTVNKKNLGRKTKSSGEVGLHNEYSQDNLIRKSKKVFSDAILEFINSKIKDLNTQLIITIDNKEYEVEKLLNLGQKITKDTSVRGNKALLKTPIKNILFQISGKYKTYNYPKSYNMAVIDELCTNEKYLEIRNILNLDYLNCLKYYRRDEDALKDDNLECLKGLEKIFDRLPKDLKKEGKDKSYEKALINTIKDIDNTFNDKKARKKRK